MSFVTRLMISPCVRLSKNFRGSRDSFSLMSLRRSNTIFWEIPAIWYCWM
jgi:hypothetical protein